VQGRLHTRRAGGRGVRAASKYARLAGQQQAQVVIVIDEAPDQVIPKGSPGAGLLTHLVIAKYIDQPPDASANENQYLPNINHHDANLYVYFFPPPGRCVELGANTSPGLPAS